MAQNLYPPRPTTNENVVIGPDNFTKDLLRDQLTNSQQRLANYDDRIARAREALGDLIDSRKVEAEIVQNLKAAIIHLDGL